jgi:hypothetical protein
MKLALAVVAGTAPLLAVACPSCARDGTPHLALLLAAMIAAPYVVALLVVNAIRGGAT